MNHPTRIRNIVPDKKDIVPPNVLTPVGAMVALHMHPVPENEQGIILPDGSQNPAQSNICTVISVGPECKQVRTGDKVLMSPAMAWHLFHKKHQYIFVKESDIACVLDPAFL